MSKKIFINLSNHPSAKWSSEQLKAAPRYGDVVDIAFPPVAATANINDIMSLAKSMVADICGAYASPDTDIRVLVQGEMTLTHALVCEFQNNIIDCYAVCSDRITEEVVNPDGTTTKKAIFKFVQFRVYPVY